MARLRVVDGEKGLQLWRVAVNALNKQPRTAERGDPPAWKLGASDLDGFFG
jgi:hypothetical protein